jgi:pseudouridine synthase
MVEERLQKLLARAGLGSRRRVEDLIRAGQVTVNGQVAQLGDRADPARDAVKVEGRRIELAAPELRYLLVHKPAAVMSTTDDPEGRPTVVDLIPPPLRKGLVPVGRLDFMTSGLLLLTNDGDLAQRVAHPRYGCTKTYEVKVSDQPLEAKLNKLRTGIVLEGRRTAPCTIEARILPRGQGSPGVSWWTVILGEGRSRQIREMFLRIGHPVQKLRRVAIGPVADAQLPPGAFRELTPREVELLRDPRKRKALEKVEKAKAVAKELAKAERGRGRARTGIRAGTRGRATAGGSRKELATAGEEPGTRTPVTKAVATKPPGKPRGPGSGRRRSWAAKERPATASRPASKSASSRSATPRGPAAEAGAKAEVKAGVKAGVKKAAAGRATKRSISPGKGPGSKSLTSQGPAKKSTARKSTGSKSLGSEGPSSRGASSRPARAPGSRPGGRATGGPGGRAAAGADGATPRRSRGSTAKPPSKPGRRPSSPSSGTRSGGSGKGGTSSRPAGGRSGSGGRSAGRKKR